MNEEDPFEEIQLDSRFQQCAEWVVRFAIIVTFTLPLIQKLLRT